MAFERYTQDTLTTKTTAIAAAGSTANSASIDLGRTTLQDTGDSIELELYCPDTPSLVDAKTVIFTFADSADDSSFTAIPELATKTITGAGGVGASAFTQTVRLPRSTRRYVRVQAVTLAAAGDNTGVSFIMRLLY
jgi:hypothetical protein